MGFVVVVVAVVAFGGGGWVFGCLVVHSQSIQLIKT